MENQLRAQGSAKHTVSACNQRAVASRSRVVSNSWRWRVNKAARAGRIRREARTKLRAAARVMKPSRPAPDRQNRFEFFGAGFLLAEGAEDARVRYRGVFVRFRVRGTGGSQGRLIKTLQIARAFGALRDSGGCAGRIRDFSCGKIPGFLSANLWKLEVLVRENTRLNSENKRIKLISERPFGFLRFGQDRIKKRAVSNVEGSWRCLNARTSQINKAAPRIHEYAKERNCFNTNYLAIVILAGECAVRIVFTREALGFLAKPYCNQSKHYSRLTVFAINARSV